MLCRNQRLAKAAHSTTSSQSMHQMASLNNVKGVSAESSEVKKNLELSAYCKVFAPIRLNIGVCAHLTEMSAECKFTLL